MNSTTLESQINLRNKSLANSNHCRRTGRWSFQNATLWIEHVKSELKDLHFKRLLAQKSVTGAKIS